MNKVKLLSLVSAFSLLASTSMAAVVVMNGTEFNASGLQFVLGGGGIDSSTTFQDENNVDYLSSDPGNGIRTLFADARITLAGEVDGEDLAFDFTVTALNPDAGQVLRMQDFSGNQWIAIGSGVDSSESLQFGISNVTIGGDTAVAFNIAFSNATWRNAGDTGTLSAGGLVESAVTNARITGFDLTFETLKDSELVPEPSSLGLLAMGAFILSKFGRSKKKTLQA